jgi:hypothetical protein
VVLSKSTSDSHSVWQMWCRSLVISAGKKCASIILHSPQTAWPQCSTSVVSPQRNLSKRNIFYTVLMYTAHNRSVWLIVFRDHHTTNCNISLLGSGSPNCYRVPSSTLCISPYLFTQNLYVKTVLFQGGVCRYIQNAMWGTIWLFID